MTAHATPEARWQQAVALHAAGRLAQAEALYRGLLVEFPVVAPLLNNLGALRLQAGDTAEARALLERSLAVDPAQADAGSNLALVLRASGQHEAALTRLEAVLARHPAHAESWNRRGLVLRDLGRLEEAIASHRRALDLTPRDGTIVGDLATTLAAAGRLTEALECHASACQLLPGHADAWSNRGLCLRRLGRMEEAVSSYRQALACQPTHRVARANLGYALEAMARFEEAEGCFDELLLQDPASAEGRYGKARLRLLAGDLQPGFALYESRFGLSGGPFVPRGPRPLEPGDDLHGCTLLLHAEQGFGDTLQFLRYAGLAAAAGARVLLEVQRPLLPLVATLAGIEAAHPVGECPIPFDRHCSLMSLPWCFGTTLGSVPAPVPYLHADAQRVREWSQYLGPRRGRRIGLAFSGRPTHRQDAQRSLPLGRLLPLFREGLEFHCLQPELCEADAAVAAGEPALRLHCARLTDFAETAALASLMDCVLTVDTSVAHLAGALGCTTWLLLAHVPDWRWLLEREDTPWYPGMRLFRQPAPGDWDSVLGQVARALAA